MSQKDKVLQIIQALSPAKVTVSEAMNLKNDLRLDSILLVQLAVQLNEELDLDLGEKADQGHTFITVNDIIKCLN